MNICKNCKNYTNTMHPQIEMCSIKSSPERINPVGGFVEYENTRCRIKNPTGECKDYKEKKKWFIYPTRGWMWDMFNQPKVPKIKMTWKKDYPAKDGTHCET